MAVEAIRVRMMILNGQIDPVIVFYLLEAIGIHGYAAYQRDVVTIITITLAIDDMRLQRLRDDLGGVVADWTERPSLLYDASELERAPYFVLTSTVTMFDGAEVRRERHIFLETGCSRCGTGSFEIATIVLREEDIPPNTLLFTTLEGDTLVADELAQHLKPFVSTNARLSQAFRYPDRIPLPWWHVVPLVSLPPMSPKSRGIIRVNAGRRQPCTVCNRDGYFWNGDVVEIFYENAVLDENSIPDIVESWEHLGYSNIEEPIENSHLAPSLLIISQRLRRVILAHSAPEIELYPIFLIDPP
jgi:hypothetical protein